MKAKAPYNKSLTRRTFIKGVAGATLFSLIQNPLLGRESEVRLGGQFSLTGPFASYGMWGHRATAAAVKKINSRREGGINGRKISYFVEDAKSNVQDGIRAMRKLIERERVDFIIGDVHSGINIACAPIAEKYNTIYFANGSAVSITADKGNRYIFRGMTNVRLTMKALEAYGIQSWGKRWYVIAADYAWGRSVARETADMVKKTRGTYVGEEFVPFPTKDLLPYIKKINPKNIDVIVVGFFGRDARNIMAQLHYLFGDEITVIGNGSMLEGYALKDLGVAGKNLWYVTQYPHRSEYVEKRLQRYDKEYRTFLGVDPEGLGSDGSIAVLSFCYASWEYVHFIKYGIEKSGWNNRHDNPGIIRSLEGMKVKGSIDFPQGDKEIRAEDHQVFHDHFIEQVENNKIVVKESVPKQALYYEPEVDYTKHDFTVNEWK